MHDPESTPGTTREWCLSRNVAFECIVAQQIKDWSKLEGAEGYIVFGGNMQAWQESEYPWLRDEKRLIGQALSSDRRVMGLCLGAQLIAECLGASPKPMPKWELGWYPVRLLSAETPILPLHWHESEFDLPPKAKALGTSEFCATQGFYLKPHQKAFQFHAEIDDVRLEHALRGWEPNRKGAIQTPEQIRRLAQTAMHHLKDWYFAELDSWWNLGGGPK